MSETPTVALRRGIELLETAGAEAALPYLEMARDGAGIPTGRLHAALGQAYRELQREDEARQALWSAVEASDDLDAEDWVRLAESLDELGMLDSAAETQTDQQLRVAAIIERIDRATEARPESAEMYVARGHLFAGLNLFNTAEEEYLYAAELDDSLIEAWTGAAECQDVLEDYEAAMDSLEEALAIDDEAVDLWAMLGEVALDAGDAVTASRAFDEAIQRGEDNLVTRLGRAMAAMALDLPAEAAEDFARAVESDSDNASLWVRLGLAHYDARADDAAIAAFSRALALEPQHVEALKRRGDTYWEQDNLDAAIADYVRAAELNPDDAETRLGLAELHIESGNHEAGVREARAALEIDPENGEASVALAHALSALGRDAEAELALHDAVDVAGGDPDVYLERARNYHARGLLNLAWRDTRFALDSGESAEALKLRGQVALDLEGPDNAAEDLSASLLLDPSDGETWALRGRAKLLQGIVAEAQSDWGEAERLLDADSPFHARIAEWRREIRVG